MLPAFLPQISTEIRQISGGVRRILKSLKTFKKCQKIFCWSSFQTQQPNAYKVHFHLFYYALTALSEMQFAIDVMTFYLFYLSIFYYFFGIPPWHATLRQKL